MQERDDIIDVTEEAEISHHQFLAEFDRDVWPIYERHGYTKDAALLAWQLNNIQNTLIRVRDAVEDDGY